MKSQQLYAVITGDVVGSSKLPPEKRNQLQPVMIKSFQAVTRVLPDAVQAPFETYRGDGFQGVLSKPETAMRAVIVLRASLRHLFEVSHKSHALDARIAVGIGHVDYLPENRSADGDGKAFRISGPLLDGMKGNQRLLFRTPWQEVNDELDVLCALLDVIIDHWTAAQAHAIVGWIRGLTQEKIAMELGISQPAARYRLKSAGNWAVDLLCRRYENLFEKL